MNKVKLNGLMLNVDPRVSSFVIHHRPSSNVDYFGIDKSAGKLFVQFRPGSCYIYSDVPEDILSHAEKAESIGKFISGYIARAFQYVKITDRLITVDQLVKTEEV